MTRIDSDADRDAAGGGEPNADAGGDESATPGEEADPLVRALDFVVSAAVYVVAGSLLAVPWALANGGGWVWFREGQFVVGALLLVVGVIFVRPSRTRRFRRDSDEDPPDLPDPAGTPAHTRRIAALLDRPPLAPDQRIAVGWRLLLAAVVLLALSAGVDGYLLR